MQGSDECARLQEHTTLLSKQLSRAAMQVCHLCWTVLIWGYTPAARVPMAG